MSIKENLQSIESTIRESVTLVAVSKTKPVEMLMEAYDAGIRDFGENKIQEMAGKWETMPKDIRWHMIGHVQSNKVKDMAEFVHLIHGVDSKKLLLEVDKQAKKFDRKIDCLLQIHIAKEETKFGLDENELDEILNDDEVLSLENVNIVGLMGMATFTENQIAVKKEFEHLNSLFEKYKNKNPKFNVLSMGMSGDYLLAIECGSTMIRVGSSIFGTR